MTLYVKTFTKRINDKYEEVNIVNINEELQNTSHIKTDRIIFIIEEFGKWTNVNHIHNWFVENVQDGIDNCATYYVTENKLQQLLETCRKVLKNPLCAAQILPNVEDQYDKDYFDEVEKTVSIIECLFSEILVDNQFIESVHYYGTY